MHEQARLHRKRQRLGDDGPAASLASRAGVLEQARGVDGGSGAVDRMLGETTNPTAAPNALLSSGTASELLQGAIAHVVGRAAEQSPSGHRFADLDILPH